MEPNSLSAFSGPFKKITATLAFLALAALPGFAQPANTVMLETWTGITGNQVSNLTSNVNYPNTPGTRTYPTLFEQPTTTATDLGTRTRAFITPPTTGVYNFYIACDDDCELWLSADDNASGRALIASVSGWTNSREWTKFTSQKSANITLTGGARYYIESLHKQGGGGGNMAVGWQGPGITADAERPIPGSRLMPFQLIAAPAITTQPANRTVTVGQTAAFTVAASGTGPTYQWRKGGVNIAGATSATYTSPATVAGDNGAVFTVKVSNAAGSATSANAILTVNSGNTAPIITVHPVDQTITEYQSATFNVTVTGTAPFTYQWQRNEVDIPGATSSSYIKSSAPPSEDRSSYRVIVGNSHGTVSSNIAFLVVQFHAKFSLQPVGTAGRVGQTVTFNIAVTANPNPSLQWRKNGVAIPGEVSFHYTTPPLTRADDGTIYSVVADNSMGSVSSNNAILTVFPPMFYADTLKAVKVVADTVVANVLVTTPKWRIPDYVFEPGYKLRSLEETDAFIQKHRHLPDVSGAAEIEKKGMNLGEMNLQLLKSVEELTLNVISLKKDLEAHKREAADLRKSWVKSRSAETK